MVTTLTFIGNRTGTHVSQVTGVSDVQIHSIGGDHFAYVTSQANGLVTVYEIGNNGFFSFVDQEVFATEGTPYGLQFMDIGDGVNVVALGTSTSSFTPMALASNGALVSDPAFDAAVSNSGNFAATISQEVNGNQYVYASRSDNPGINLYKLDDNDTLQAHPAGSLNPEDQTNNVGAMATVTLASDTFLYATSLTDQEISIYRIKPNGLPEYLTTFGVEQNLGIAEPNHLETVEIGADTFLVMGSSGSSSITIFKVMEGGHLMVTDHVFDELNTRFQNLTEMKVVAVEDRAFVIAGGADDGLTLLELLPNGVLIHHDTIADSLNSSLDGVSGLDAYVDGTTIHVFAAGQNDTGVSHFTFGLGATGETVIGGFSADTISGSSNQDILSGGNGNDKIYGWGGNDVLVDGAGQDTLTGGTGADRFVLTSDNSHDIITDFQVGVDTLDLSNYQLFRNMDQLSVTSHSDGATATFFGETLRIYTSNNQSMDFDDFAAMNLISLTHMTIGLTPQDLVLEGGAEADALVGGLGNDRLLGLNGDDILSGSAGADHLVGGNGDDCADYSTALIGVTIDMKDMSQNTGDAAGDVFSSVEHILGSTHEDQLFGDTQNNHLMGGQGNDGLRGREGHDLIQGDNGNDNLLGNGGRDTLLGGNGRDTLTGHSGRDILNGGSNEDILTGGRGNDVYLGGDGADTFVFHEDADKIRDFENDIDTLLIDSTMVGNGITTGQDVVQTYGSIQNGDAFLDFGNGHSVTLLNVSNLNELYNDVDLF